jgi:hypothetical protein
MDLTYDEKERYVWALCSGPWTIDELCSKPPLILAECQARRLNLLLVDLSKMESRELPTGERFQIAASIMMFAGKLRKVAVLASTDVIDPEKFGERVARNRGVNVRVFSSLELAQRWLLDARS